MFGELPYEAMLFQEAGAEGAGGGAAEPTPAGSGNSGATPPSADPKDGTPQPPADNGGTPEPADTGKPPEGYFTKDQMEKAVKERLERERKKLQSEWEAEQKKVAERAKMDEQQRLAAEKADLEEALNTERTQLQTLRQELAIRDALGTKVRSVTKALKLFDPEVHMADGEVLVEKFLEDYPEEAPGQETGETTPPSGAKIPSPRSGTPSPLSREEIANMSAEEYEKRRDEITKALAEGRIR